MVFYTHYYRMEEKPLKALAQLRGLSGEGTVEEVIASLHAQDEETEQRKQREREAAAAKAASTTGGVDGDVDIPDSEWSVVGKDKKKVEKNVVDDAGKPEAKSKAGDDGHTTKAEESQAVTISTPALEPSKTTELQDDLPTISPNTAPESRVAPPAVHEHDAQVNDKPKKKKKNRRGGRNKKKAKQAAQATPDTASASETAKEEQFEGAQPGVSRDEQDVDAVAGKPSKVLGEESPSLARGVEDADEPIVTVEDADEQGPVVMVDSVLSVATSVHGSSTDVVQGDSHNDPAKELSAVADSDATQRPPTAHSVPDTQLTETELIPGVSVSDPKATQDPPADHNALGTPLTQAEIMSAAPEEQLIQTGKAHDELTEASLSTPTPEQQPHGIEDLPGMVSLDICTDDDTSAKDHSPPDNDSDMPADTVEDRPASATQEGDTDTAAKKDVPLPKKKAKKGGKKGGKRVNKQSKAEMGSSSPKSTVCFAVGAVLFGILSVGVGAWAMI